MAGCRTAPPPNLGHGPLTPQEVSDIVGGKKTVVLFRLTTIADETQEALDYQQKIRWKIWQVGDWQRFHGLTDGTARTPSEWRTPPAATHHDGWRYVVLEPGRYFIQPRPANAVGDPYPIYHLSVPPGQKVVYAGSFPFTASPSGNKQQTYDSGGVRDETGAAREIVRGLVSADEVKTVIVIPNDLAVAVGPYSRKNFEIFASTNYPMGPTKDVGRKAGVILAAPVAISGLALLGLAYVTLDTGNDDDIPDYTSSRTTKKSKGGKPKSTADGVKDTEALLAVDLLAAGVGITLVAAAFPVAEIGDLTLGGVVRYTWKPHKEALRHEIRRFDLAGHLTNSLSQALASEGVNPDLAVQPATNSVPRTNLVGRVGTFGCCLYPNDFFGWKYRFRTAAYLSLVDPDSHQVIWEHGYMYGDAEHRRGAPPFITFVLGSQKPRSLGAYKGAAGMNLIRQRLEAADKRLSDAMAADLKDAGF